MSPAAWISGGGAPVDEVVSASAVVIGAGVAGLSSALGLAQNLQGDDPVIVLSKTPLQTGCSSVWAQGGIAAAVGADDSTQLHADDTLAAGAELCDSERVRLLAEGAPGCIANLMRLGARFDRLADGSIALGREAVHSRPRILRADGDATGAEIVRALAEAALRCGRVRVEENAFAIDLACEGGRVGGVTARLSNGCDVLLAAPVVVLATGGLGRLYLHTTNPVEATADGLAMAFRAGARLADLEFVQFHPTALRAAGDPMPLMTEALRGEGAILIDDRGLRFMPDEHPLAELAPRDVVARAIWNRRAAGRQVYLDARQAVGERFRQRFPTVFAHCRTAGIDPRSEPIPVSPAAHYFIGGVETDAMGRASLPGLWACGEAAATGVHGANRLASNSLLEGLVFGARAAGDASRFARRHEAPRVLSLLRHLRPAPRQLRSSEGESERILALRALMWEKGGLVRDESGLRGALGSSIFEVRSANGSQEYLNLTTAGSLILRAALQRRESRGVHFRSDYPQPDPSQARRASTFNSRCRRSEKRKNRAIFSLFASPAP